MQQYLTTFVPFLFITRYLGKLNIYGEMLDRLYVDNSTPLKPLIIQTIRSKPTPQLYFS
jgi:hypothetical protein